MDKNKNVIACLEVAQKLKSLSVVFRWIIVGDGTEREYIATQIADSHGQAPIREPVLKGVRLF